MENQNNQNYLLEKILEDTVELINLTRKGIAYSMFSSIATASPFSMKEWSNFLHVSERTLQRYNKSEKLFEPRHTERILEIAQIQKKGTEVFESSDTFNQWLNIENLALGGIKPKELLDNSFGIQLLNDELGRIEHGIFV
ncbi:MAG: antitoxin Xre/MbcA/ParS toxin-binding domain-containing protein [Bacteroidota bacterium]